MTLVSCLQAPVAIALVAQVMFAAMPIAVNAQGLSSSSSLSIFSRDFTNQSDQATRSKYSKYTDRHNGRRLEQQLHNYRAQSIESTNVVNTTNNRPAPENQRRANTGEKVGATRRLPNLQTRARPPLQPDTLHMGMVQKQFFDYANDNNWQALETKVSNEATFYQWLPGGEAIYALPEQDLVYARGFIANVYFQDGRLVGMRLMPDRREQIINAKQLLTLARAWFPDDVLSILYQVTPSDPNQLIVDSLIGSVPEDFKDNFGNNNFPFCRVVVFPAPVPMSASLANCATTIPPAKDAVGKNNLG
jgi:hypothetical protein